MRMLAYVLGGSLVGLAAGWIAFGLVSKVENDPIGRLMLEVASALLGSIVGAGVGSSRGDNRTRY